jgi:MFS family permease
MSIIGNPPESTTRRFSTGWLFLLIVILFVVLVRARLLDFPLERDEGEYAYMGQLILRGIPPYSEAYNMKFPGTYLMYALIMAIFGQTIEGIHIGLMFVNCAAIVLLFYLARKVISDFGALIASGTYALLSLSSSVLGFAAHATHFVVLPALGGTLLLLHADEGKKLHLYFAAGVLLGLAFLMKQPGIFFLLFGAVYVIYRHFSENRDTSHFQEDGLKKSRIRKWDVSLFSLGVSLPIVITGLWLYFAGVFDRFWFWTFEYASKYGSQIPLSGAFSVFRFNFWNTARSFLPLWVLGALGFMVTLFHTDFKKIRFLMVIFTLFSFLTVCPGFYFRQHYFITFLPALSLLVGILFDYIGKKGSVVANAGHVKIAISGIFLAVVMVGVIGQKEYFFRDNPVKLSRTIYGANPFPESVEIARFIEANTAPTDKVAVLGSEPQIFFYAKRHSSTGYIYTYSLMEIHEYALTMQKEMVMELEASGPKFIVVVPISSSWLIRPESEKFILDWTGDYLNRNYSLAGVADIISPEVTVYKWYDEARNYRVQSEAYVLVYERAR